MKADHIQIKQGQGQNWVSYKLTEGETQWEFAHRRHMETEGPIGQATSEIKPAGSKIHKHGTRRPLPEEGMPLRRGLRGVDNLIQRHMVQDQNSATSEGSEA